MRQTKEHKEAYDRLWKLIEQPITRDEVKSWLSELNEKVKERQRKDIEDWFGATHEYAMGARPIADITILEDNTVIITPVSEINSTDETN